MLTGWRAFDDAFRALDLLQRRFDRDFWRDAVLPDMVSPRTNGRRVDFEDRWGRGPAAWPATNIYESKEGFVIKAEVPGLTEKDVSVSVEDGALVLRGERKASVPEGYQVHLRERASVAFTRKLPLPARIDANGVTATLNDGVLTITLPKAKDALPRQIAVRMES